MLLRRTRFAILSALCIASASAGAETRADLCAPPKMQTDKWRTVSEAGGMSVMLPPGYAAHGVSGTSSSADAHFYTNGRKSIVIGSGSGPSVLDRGGSSMNQKEDCLTFINGRRVELTMYDWTVEDQSMSPSGDAGTHYGLVARFLTSSTYREVFIAITSNMKSDVMFNREVIWTATFRGAPMTAGATPASATMSSSLVAAGPAAVAPAQSAPAPAAPTSRPDTGQLAAPVCIQHPDPKLPTADAVFDTGLVQSLMSGTGAVPKGFAQMVLHFDNSGALVNIAVPQSDMPDPVQRQLATLVASNLKPHDGKSPATFMLRVDSKDDGLHYEVEPPCSQK